MHAVNHSVPPRLRKLPLKSFGPKGCCPVLNVDCVVGAPGDSVVSALVSEFMSHRSSLQENWPLPL